MNRQQALEVLGIYEGTSKQRIEEKFAAMLDTATEQQVILLREARALLLEDAPSNTLQRAIVQNPSDANRKKGRWVIVALLLAILGSFSLAVAGMFLFDSQPTPKAANSRLAEAEQLSLDYKGFLESSGAKPHALALQADALLAEGRKLREAKDYTAAADKLAAARDAYTEAFKSDAATTLKIWNEQVVATFKTDLKSKFPFDPTSETEADVADIVAIFNPVDGHLHTASRRMTTLSIIKIGDEPLLITPMNYTSSIGAAMRISEALFSTDSRNIVVNFEARLLPYSKRSGLEMMFDDQRIRADNTKPEVVSMQLNGTSKTVFFAMKVLFLVPKERRAELDGKPGIKFESAWGLLGALSQFAEVESAEGRTVLWKAVPHRTTNGRKPSERRDTRERKEITIPQLELTTATDANAFNLKIYKAFRP
ncbi:hypothetical protein OAU50_08195 [Planctomycetota bacterium]|nr:hypothetical protein [Planctomycetota bacterium]